MNANKLVIPAETENLPLVIEFIERQLESALCPMKTQMQICIAVEEIFVNIACYAYAPGRGDAAVTTEFSEDSAEVTISFTDRGVPFDPLAKPDPDITLCMQDREIGGLGIFMTKKTMDEVSYEYKNGENILRMKKRL